MYSFDLKIRLVRYYNRYCKSIRKIASMFSVSKSSLSRWINNICLVRKQYSVRENVRILRFIKNSLNHNPFQTLRSLKERILKRLGKSYCLRTICRYINIIGYSKKKIVRKMYNGSLIDQQKKRKEFSKKINDAINSVADSQNKASKITKDYELGKETDLTKVIMQQQISNIAFQMTLNVRNKVLSSYKDIMNMPV